MTCSDTKAAALLLNFGEPSSPDLAEVTKFLERIFLVNARLEPGEATPPSVDAAAARARARSRELAERRAPGLAEAYRKIGGSPLNAQAIAQAAALGRVLGQRGHPMPVVAGMQYTAPSIEDAVTGLREAGADTIVALPVYPLCGPSTTVAALDEMDRALARMDWRPTVRRITGWQRHPDYAPLRSRAIRRAAADAKWDLADPALRVVFSAHGTPLQYLREGSRYATYAEEWVAIMARELGIDEWTLGYQNHSNRKIEWTQPSIETALDSLAGVSKVLVDPISFMHEQSETLMELDVDLADHAAALGLEYRRVPIPHDDDIFAEVLADLTLAALGDKAPKLPRRTRCRCRPGTDLCLNAPAH